MSARSGPRLRINARLVRERDRARARELRRLLIHGALIAVPLLAYVGQRVDFIRQSYRVAKLKQEKQGLLEAHKQLVVERSYLLAPDRIEALARRQLGLVDPAPEDVRPVMLRDGRVDLGDRRAAAAGAGDDAGPGLARAALAAVGAGPRLPSVRAPGESR
jgi:cell division protein FtsL